MTRELDVLFLTWEGPRSTYLEGVFLPIFAALRPRGFRFHVLHFTWSDQDERERMARACAEANVSYRSVSIWRRPIGPGSLATALLGRKAVRAAIRDLDIRLVMPRSTLPALAAIPAAKGLPLLLDADGLPHDERIEFQGASHRDWSYRMLRRLEAWSVQRADAVTVRSPRAAELLAERAQVPSERFRVVPSTRNAELFRPPSRDQWQAARAALKLEVGSPLLAYVGSALTGKYMGREMLAMFRHVLARRPDARLLLIVADEREARALLQGHPELASHCAVRSAAPNEVPRWIGAADLGLALIRSTFSMQAASAIKIGEYLLCGVPALVTAGVGEAEDVVGPDVGRCLREVSEESLAQAADWFVDQVLPDCAGFRQRCREVGLRHFSLQHAVKGYEEALRSALSAGSRG